MKNKKLVEGPFAIKMPETLAKSVEALLKTLPKEYHRIERKATVPVNSELVPGERASIAMVSVESIDREREVVLAKGINLDFFRKNPIVTFAHKYDELPVGKAQWIRQVMGGVKAKTIYSSRPEGWEGNWLPDAVWSMTREGVLKGFSVGFVPTKIRPPEPGETQWKNATAVIESCVLLEYAIAPVPCNQDALVEAVAKGMADADTLRRLGLQVKSVPKRNDADLLLKALGNLTIDPDRILALVEKQMRNRGKV